MGYTNYGSKIALVRIVSFMFFLEPESCMSYMLFKKRRKQRPKVILIWRGKD